MDSPQKLKKMSFSQKITRSSNPDSLVGCLGPPLKTLNRIRNKFAHEPGYQLQELDLEPLADFNAAWHRITGRPLRDKGLDALTEFTWMACVGINHVSFLLRQEPGVGIEGWVRRWKESFPDDGQV
jgi:hypothetical protein